MGSIYFSYVYSVWWVGVKLLQSILGHIGWWYYLHAILLCDEWGCHVYYLPHRDWCHDGVHDGGDGLCNGADTLHVL